MSDVVKNVESTAWAGGAIFGVVTAGLGITWMQSRSQLRACEANPASWLLPCFSQSIDEAVKRRFMLITGVLAVAAVTTATVAHVYRRKRRR